MTKKNAGLAKTAVLRIHPDVKSDLNFIKKEVGLTIGKHSEGDVIEQLVRMYKAKKIGDPSFRLPPKEDPIQKTIDKYINIRHLDLVDVGILEEQSMAIEVNAR